MPKNKETCRCFSICHLSVPDFLTKNFLRSQIREIQQRKKEPLTLVSGGMKSNCINNCPLKTVHFEHFWRITTWNPNWEFEREGFLCKQIHSKVSSLASYWIPEGKQRNEEEKKGIKITENQTAGMKRNGSKCQKTKKHAGVFPYAILVFQIFWQKTF